ncbi:MAG: hypothetical protein ACI83O_000560 [Patescibacteria group bacterium]|jgi:hypothetical protein
MKMKFDKVFLLLFFGIFLVAFSSGVETILSEASVCCERTTSGQWCVNDDASECDANYRNAPAACGSTSFCKLGSCYDSSEGICYENTPQRVCDDNGGTWDERELGEVPQCQLGCCLVGDEAAFVPLVRCKKLSTYFGVNVDYRTDITSETSCIALANSQDRGACVYEQEFERVCEYTTRGECGAEESVEAVDAVRQDDAIGSARKFFDGLLCSAEELNTVCGRQATTGCYQGDAHYYDSCGNRENVVSSDRDLSWNEGRAIEADGICPPNSADGSDPDCGNCDYLLGSRCESSTGLLSGENAYCQRTVCTDRWGDERNNGESWCVNDGLSGDGKDKVGSRYHREVCVDGEVRVEACADFRNEVCFESSLETTAGDYSVAACRVNRWQDCIGVTDQGACLNGDKRDCTWLPSPSGLLIGGSEAGSATDSTLSNPTVGNTGGSTFTNPTAPAGTGNALFGGDDERGENETTTTNREDGVCVPRFSPGLQFWEEGSAQSVCAAVSANCVVKFSKGAFGDFECEENCHCLNEEWAVAMNQVCVAVGDCGAYVNYEGKFTDSGYEWKSSTDRLSFTGNAEGFIRSGFSGNVIKNINAELFA